MNGNPFYVSPLGGLNVGQSIQNMGNQWRQNELYEQAQQEQEAQQQKQAQVMELAKKAIDGDIEAAQQVYLADPNMGAQVDKALGIQSENQRKQAAGFFEQYLSLPKGQARTDFLQRTAGKTPFTLDDDLLAMDEETRDRNAMLASANYLSKEQLSMLQSDKKQSFQQGSGDMSGYVFNPNTGQYSINPQVQDKLESIRTQAEIKNGKVDAKTRQSINKDITQLTKDTTSIRNTAADLDKLSKVGGGPAAIAMVFKFMKALDPQSVVREGEFATAENSAGVDDKILNMYNKLLEGERLTPEQMQQFIGTAKELANSAIDASNSEIGNYLDTFEDTLPDGFKNSLKKRIPERFDITPQNNKDPLGLGI